MENNLRKIAVHFYEEWNAIFAKMETEFLTPDFQVLTNHKKIATKDIFYPYMFLTYSLNHYIQE